MSGKEYRKSAHARRAIAGIFVVCVLVVALELIFAAYPLRRDKLRIADELADVNAGISSFQAKAGARPIEERLEAARTANARMKSAWDRLKWRVSTFGEQEKLADILASSEEGRIDYKVALFDARQWIEYQSRNNDTTFPPDLGMKEAVGTDEVMESKLWQLAANVSLAEVVISSGIESVEAIAVLEPVLRSLTIGEHPYLTLYPVEVQMRGSYSDLLKFMRNISGEERFFVPLRLLVENVDPSRPDQLTIRTACAALVLKKELPGALEEEDEGMPEEDFETDIDAEAEGRI